MGTVIFDIDSSSNLKLLIEGAVSPFLANISIRLLLQPAPGITRSA